MPNYDELIGYLNQLCLEKADGILFITTDKNHSVRFELFDGNIISCSYRLKRDHDAIELIKTVKAGRYKFFTGMSEPEDKAIARRGDLYTALFGKTSPSPKEQKAAPVTGSISLKAPLPPDTDNTEKALETIAKELARFIGPVARLICDECINNNGKVHSTDDLIAMTESVATEIGDSVQEIKFTEVVLGSIPSVS